MNKNPRRHYAFALPAAAACALLFLSALPLGRGGAAVARQNPAASDSTQATTAAVFGPDTSGLLKLTVTVTDKSGRFVTGLRRESFAVSEGKAAQELTHFDDSESPQSVGVVFDVSKSMSPAALAFARGGLVRLMRQAHASNEYFIVGFNNQTHLLADWTRDGKTIIEALNKLGHLKPTQTGTAFYDALEAGVRRAASGQQPRRVVLVVSDGQDIGSKLSRPKLRELIKRSDVLVYGVGVADRVDESALAYDGRATLEDLSWLSGGKAYFPSTETEIDDTFRRIGLELHSQYVVGYKPTAGAADGGKWRKFKVDVRPPSGWPSIFVRTREGFYARPSPPSP